MEKISTIHLENVIYRGAHKVIVIEVIVVEKSGLYELWLVFAFLCAGALGCIFSFGDLLDAATGAGFQLTEVGNDTLTWSLGGSIRFCQVLVAAKLLPRPVREFFAVRFFVAWSDKHAGIVR